MYIIVHQCISLNISVLCISMYIIIYQWISLYRTEMGGNLECPVYQCVSLYINVYRCISLYRTEMGGNLECRVYQCDTCPLSGDQWVLSPLYIETTCPSHHLGVYMDHILYGIWYIWDQRVLSPLYIETTCLSEYGVTIWGMDGGSFSTDCAP